MFTKSKNIALRSRRISAPNPPLEYDKQRKQSVNQETRVRYQRAMLIAAIRE